MQSPRIGSWIVIACLIATWAVGQCLLPHREFRSCVGGICQAMRHDSPSR
jgi:hypothetical protein